MPLIAIPGTFQLIGASPDGDSVRFYPDDPQAFTDANLTVRANSKGGVQLRLDAIDALETHYTPRSAPHPWHQQPALGQAAAARLVELLGFRDVVRNQRGVVTSCTPQARPGYILTRFADKYGRAVSFAFPGHRRAGASDAVYLKPKDLRKSVNWHLINEGLAYPTFYSKLYYDLREELAATAVKARGARLGVWAHDATLSGFRLKSRAQLQDDAVILPKLFRRLADYLTLDEPDSVSLAGFTAYLKTLDDRLFTVPTGQATAFDTLVERKGQTLRLTLPPERIVFLEK